MVKYLFLATCVSFHFSLAMQQQLNKPVDIAQIKTNEESFTYILKKYVVSKKKLHILNIELHDKATGYYVGRDWMYSEASAGLQLLFPIAGTHSHATDEIRPKLWQEFQYHERTVLAPFSHQYFLNQKDWSLEFIKNGDEYTLGEITFIEKKSNSCCSVQ